MIKDNVLIDISDIELAQEFCNIIEDSKIRSRSAANVLGPNLAKKILSEYSIDIESGLYNIIDVLKDIDISDIYINNSFIDVRLYTEGEPLTVPAELVNYISPTAFMFIKVTPDLHSGTLSGFLPTNMINRHDPDTNSYIFQESDLLPFEDIEPILVNNNSCDIIDDIRIYDYLDNKIEDKYSFYSQLVRSKESRIKLGKYIKAQSILNFISSAFSDSDNTKTVVSDVSIDTDNIELSSNVAQESIFSDLLEDSDNDEENIIDTTLSLLEEPDSSNNYSNNSDEYSTNTFTNINSGIVDEGEDDDVNSEVFTDESIDELFSEETLNNESEQEQKKGSNTFRIILLSIIALLVASMAYFGFNKLSTSQKNNLQNSDSINNEISSVSNSSQSSLDGNTDAMPLESVETNSSKESKEVGNPVNIPTIEKNLDSAVIVSNLKVDWEVPSGYASNTSAKRYLIKLGKIIQHNLKTELLLLNKPPITSNVTIEIKFNSLHGQFETVGITTSSGESNVDNIILTTVKNALKIKLSSNISTFAKLQGNPILVIHF